MQHQTKSFHSIAIGGRGEGGGDGGTKGGSGKAEVYMERGRDWEREWDKEREYIPILLEHSYNEELLNITRTQDTLKMVNAVINFSAVAAS